MCFTTKIIAYVLKIQQNLPQTWGVNLLVMVNSIVFVAFTTHIHTNESINSVSL